MPIIELNKKNKQKKYLLLALFFALIAWVLYSLIFPAAKFETERVILEIAGPQSLLSGQDIAYTIKYGNQERVNLNNAELNVYFPENFVLTETAPLSSSAADNPGATSRINNWKLGQLKVGQTGEIEIKGRIIAEKGKQTLTASLSYKPENFNSEFEKNAILETEIASAILSLNIDGPTQITADEKVTYKLTYQNNLKDTEKNSKITVIYPPGFIVEKSKPAPSAEKPALRDAGNIWYKDNLEFNQPETIEITGSFAQGSSGKKDLKAKIEIKDGANLILSEEKTLSTAIVKEGLLLNLIINGSTDSRPVILGDYLNYSITFRNNGQSTMADLEVTATLDGEILDWSSIDDKNKGLILGDQIIWDKNLVPALALLPSGNSGSIDFRIKTKDMSFVAGLTGDKLQATSLAEIKIGQINGQENNSILKSTAIITKINTDLDLRVAGRYFNDDNITVGSGPIPPKVGAATSYQISWTVTNTLHEVKNIKIKTVLPANISWTGVSGIATGQLAYDPTAREISWQINRLPVGVTELTASFNVSLTPSEDQVGKILILTPETTLEAVDSETNAPINLTREAITTNLETDPIAKGKGVVAR